MGAGRFTQTRVSCVWSGAETRVREGRKKVPQRLRAGYASGNIQPVLERMTEHSVGTSQFLRRTKTSERPVCSPVSPCAPFQSACRQLAEEVETVDCRIWGFKNLNRRPRWLPFRTKRERL